ncbi:MAG: uroporphyrinogen-III C-methyltransferase [Desulfosporosinus sp.]|jgi:uroporphyrinogen III methyltransferase/synthase
MTKGYVYLVGAGPGDPKLITVKGSECIAKADVLVYDRLVSQRLLALTRPECELIYVGKSPDHHTLGQEEINQLLVAKAMEGKVVTRLKGGDPFVFGRGGEEAEALFEASISFEVIPGVTSAIAVPAYAGIPVTHRDLTSSFAVITGHEDPTKNESTIYWNHLAQSHGTLVFLMGMQNLPLIVQKLLENGKQPTTPVAIIQWGTRPEQHTLVGQLDTISIEVQEKGFTNPAVIIVGEVVSMREKLQWFEKKPLFGRRIVVTRARHQASELSQAIEALGGEALEFPTIEIAPPSKKSYLINAINNLQSFHWLIFTSVNGVEVFFAELKKLERDIRDLTGMEIVAIGPATQAALEKRGLRIAYVPNEYRAEKIVEGLTNRVKVGQKVLLARAEEARDILPRSLKAYGLEVWDVPVYKTVIGGANRAALLSMLSKKEIHAVTFTSSSTVKNFVTLLDNDISLLENVLLYSIGPITSATAQALGLTIYKEAARYTISGLIEAILEGK